MVLIEDKSELSSAMSDVLLRTPSSVSADLMSVDMLNEPPRLPEKEQPPPYTAPPNGTQIIAQGPPPVGISTIPRLPPSNYLDIQRMNGSVKGDWLVDTNLTIPPSVLPPIKEGEIRPHIKFTTMNGAINANIELVGGTERVIIKAETMNGSVTMRFTNPNGQRIDLNASTHNGAVQIYLPRTFHGPIYGGTTIGKVTFSPEMSQNLTVFSERDGGKRCFLGPWTGTDYGHDGKLWTKDQAHVETTNGSVKFYFIDELACGKKGKGKEGMASFWRTLF